MIGIVLVSHSEKLAEGVVELAKGMGGEDLKIQGVGGLDTPDHQLGTNPAKIMDAINQVFSEEGVLVLMDLGSALLSTEMAVEMLPPDRAEKITLCAAPLVEGAVAAAVQARLGSPMEQVVAEARGALAAKADHLGEEPADLSVAVPVMSEMALDGNAVELHLTVKNPLGLHARPAARFVQTVGAFSDTNVLVKNETTGRGPVSAKSINGVATLGVLQGHEITISASGPQAQAALDALQHLADDNFGDKGDQAPPTAPPAEPPTPVSEAKPGEPICGQPVSPGFAFGPVILFRPETPVVPDHKIDNPQAEWETFLKSLEKTRSQIAADKADAARRTDSYTAAIFEAHLLFLDDEALQQPTRSLIFEQKMNAAAAWWHTVEQVSAEYRGLDAAYLQTRAKDVEDVGRLVLFNLLGLKSYTPIIDKPGILVAADLTPAETTHLDPTNVKGILTAYGGPTSHSAILARSLGIPAVSGLGDMALKLHEGDFLVMDGEKGQVWVNPDDGVIKDYEEKARAALAEKQKALAEGQAKAVTKDGHAVEIAANIRSAQEAKLAVEAGAEGVGLFRTEFLFLGRDDAPGEEEQYRVYADTAAALKGRPLIIRTLDAGGDKSIPYLNLEQEANPFLGWRAIRLCLEYPELFKTQLRAIQRAAAEYPVKVMFPMVSNVEEFHQARDLLTQAGSEVLAKGQKAPDRIETGIMVEVPSTAIMADEFAREVDFFSIGTNDLTQYTFAAERGNPHVTKIGDAFHPAVLRLIGRVVEAAHANGKWVGICGELAGDERAIPTLVGLGVDELSMNAVAIPRAKQIIRGLDYASARREAQQTLKLDGEKMGL